MAPRSGSRSPSTPLPWEGSGTISPNAGGRWGPGPDPRLPWPRPQLCSLALKSACEVPAA